MSLQSRPKNHIRRSAGEWAFDIINTLFLILLAIVTLYPFLYVLFSSVSLPSRMISRTGLLLAPQGFQLDAYRMVFMNPMISKGYMNTIIYLVFGLAVNMMLTILAAYALSRKGLYFKKGLSLLIIFTMFFSGGLVPLFLTVQSYGMLNTRLALILPSAMSAYNMIIMRTGFESIPPSLEESAKLDGANHLQICFRIILPLSLPVIAVIALYYGVYHWNAWYHALIFLKDRSLFPLQIILREILIQNQTDSMMTDSGMGESLGEAIKYAAIIVATVPVVCVYPFLQRFFVKGIMIGAVKE